MSLLERPALRRLPLIVVAALAAVAPVAAALAADPPPATRRAVDAPQLVRDAVASEAWLADVDSFHLVAESTWTKTDAAIERRRAELRERFPDVEPTEANFPELKPRSHDALEIAFDRERIAIRRVSPDTAIPANHKVFDGDVVRSRFDGRSGDEIRRTWGLLADGAVGEFESLLADLSWPQAGPRAWWWRSPEDVAAEAEHLAKPEDYGYVGRETFRGVECFVIESGGGNRRRLYVGVDDGRLRGDVGFNVPQNEATAVAFLGAARDAGAAVEDGRAAQAWFASLDVEARRAVVADYWRRVGPHMRPWVRNWMDDYREVAPGRFVPMAQGYELYDMSGEGAVASRREMRVVEVRVDEPLDDALFELPFDLPGTVMDRRVEPTLFYEWDPEATPEAQAAAKLAGEAQRQERMKRTDAMDALVGQAAPPLPVEAEWLHVEGGPPTLASLRGKVVVLSFLAEWCGPCRGSLGPAQAVHEGDSGIVVIGVHTAGADRDGLGRMIADYNLTLPILIDVPAEDAWGQVYRDYAIYGIPHAFVIGPDGTVAGHGSLTADVLPIAHRLARGERRDDEARP